MLQGWAVLCATVWAWKRCKAREGKGWLIFINDKIALWWQTLPDKTPSLGCVGYTEKLFSYFPWTF